MKRAWRLSLYAGVLLMIAFSSPFFIYTDIFADSPQLIISEIKVRNDVNGLDEFIELYNPTDTTIALNDFTIGYVNSPSPTVSTIFDTVIVGDGLLESEHSFVLAKMN